MTLNKPHLPLLSLALLLGACSTPIPLMTTSALQAFKAIPNSRQAPCNLQKSIAEHNSTYDTLRTGKETVYKAPCVIEKKPISSATS